MTLIAVRAWLTAVICLGLAGAAVTSLSAGGTATSLTRMAIAAGVLSAYTAVVGLIVTPRAERTWARCLWWGGLVPAVVAILATVLVAIASGLGPGIVAGLPWLVGSIPVCLAGRWLPALPSLSRFRRTDG